MKYLNYSVNDFVMDDDFCKWVQNTGKNPDLDNRWYSWLQKHPEKKQEVKEAKYIILHFDFRKYQSGDEELVKAAIDEQIRKFEQQKSGTIIRSLKGLGNHWGKMAAAIAFIVAISWGTFQFLQAPEVIKYTTGYGETRTVILPNSSEVTLNANSTLTFNAGWQSKGVPATREVTLQGEAFFHVKEYNSASSGASKFIVHTGNLDVQVLGTRFNVQERRGNTRVVLNSGKVQLLFPEEVFPNRQTSRDKIKTKGMIMEPGDMVAYSGKSKKITKKKVEVEKVTAWRHNKFVFEDMTLQNIARRLEDFHGVDILIEDSVLAYTHLTGTFPSQDLEMVLNALPTLIDMNIEKDDKKIIFSEK